MSDFFEFGDTLFDERDRQEYKRRAKEKREADRRRLEARSELDRMIRAYGSDTSRLAAQRMIGRTGTVRRKAFEALRQAMPLGMSNLAVETMFDNHKSTYRTRVSELVDMGFVRDSGRRVREEGELRIVWVVTERGMQL